MLTALNTKSKIKKITDIPLFNKIQINIKAILWLRICPVKQQFANYNLNENNPLFVYIQTTNLMQY